MKDNEDVIKRYAEKRKPLSEEDVEDLYRCITGYIKKIVSEDNDYAIKIPRIGFLYKKFKKEDMKRSIKMDNSLINRIILDLALNEEKVKNLLVKKDLLERFYGKNFELREIQDFQNDR